MPEVPRGKSLSFSLDTEFYRTSANYTKLGEFKDLDAKGMAFFQYVSFKPKLTYFPSRWFSMSLFGGGIWANSVSKDSPGKEDFERISGLRPNLYGGGFDLYGHAGALHFSTGLRGGGSLSRLTETDEMVIGCGCYFIEPSLWVIYDIKSFVYFFYGTHFRYRTAQLSSLWFHKAGGYIQTGRVDFGFSTDLFFSAFSDFYKNQPEKRTAVLDEVNAGSYRFYSVNPSALSFTTWIEWKVKPLFVSLYGNVDINGRNYSRGLTIGINTKLKFSLGSESTVDYKDYEYLKRKSRERGESEYFEEDEESQQQEESEYFEEEEPPQREEPEYFEEEEKPQYNREPKSSRKKRVKRAKKKRSKKSASPLSRELRKEIYNLRQ